MNSSVMITEEADVLVIGGGPVGLAMATELSYRGIKAILIEKKPTTSTLAKALGINSRSMEQFRRLGLQEQIAEASYPRDFKPTFVFSTSATGPLVFSGKLSSWGELADGVPGATFPFYQPGESISCPMFCPQHTLEPIMKAHLEAFSNTKMYWGWEVSSLMQDEDGVTIKATHTPTSGEPQEKIFKAKYLVGCDVHAKSLQNYLQDLYVAGVNFHFYLMRSHICVAV